METKRRALDEIAARQNAADEKGKADAERMEHGAGKAQFSAGIVDCIAIPAAEIHPNARTSTIKRVQ